MTDDKDFKTLLSNLYKKEPCRVLPTAIWKTIERLNSLQCSYWDFDSDIYKLEGWDQNGLHIFWNKDREVDQSFHQIMKRASFMIIHNDYFQQISADEYKVVKPYFRIIHDNNSILPYSLNERYYIVESDAHKESKEVSEFITRCYKDFRPSSETVLNWTKHKVFDKNLWIWIIDKHKNAPAALGLAEFDSNVPEGSLEWIQVLPEYQGNGLGKVLVLELLNRLKGRVDFTTVSGEVDNETNPERLYRRCGFYGNDVWWLLRK